MKPLFVAFGVMILASGCVQQPAGENPVSIPGGKEFRMTILHTGYSPPLLEVNKGDIVRILAVTGTGTAAHSHGMTIDEYGVNATVATENADSPVKVEFVADRAGNFTIYCASCSQGIFGTAHPDIRATLVVK